MRWKNMSDKCQVLKWQRVTGHGLNGNGSTVWKLKCVAAELNTKLERKQYDRFAGMQTKNR